MRFLVLTVLVACSDYNLNSADKRSEPGERPPKETAEPEDTADTAPPEDTADTAPPEDTSPPVDETVPVADAGLDQEVGPLDTVWLDGSASYDPGGNEPLTYQWKLLSKPSGSTADITWVSTWETPVFFADLAGDYVFELGVTNTLGASDPTPDEVTITAKPSDGFYVQVSWNTSDTDIDLHILRTASTQIFDSPDDCCFCNMNPSWYATGSGDDPSQDWDDIDGYGPETTTIDSPANGSYRVLLHFYGENGMTSCDGPCKPTDIAVKVYVAGTEIGSYTGTLTDQGQVWEVATFDWPSQTLTTTDTTTTTTRTACY